MTYEEYRKLKGVDFINASREHPDFLQRIKGERTQALLDDAELTISLLYLQEHNATHHDDRVYKEQVRALFVAYCLNHVVEPFTHDYDAILAKFAEEYKPDDARQFYQFMGEYVELDDTAELMELMGDM